MYWNFFLRGFPSAATPNALIGRAKLGWYVFFTSTFFFSSGFSVDCSSKGGHRMRPLGSYVLELFFYGVFRRLRLQTRSLDAPNSAGMYSSQTPFFFFGVFRRLRLQTRSLNAFAPLVCIGTFFFYGVFRRLRLQMPSLDAPRLVLLDQAAPRRLADPQCTP
jgi:hypothetical protein